jgi:endonuclease/exonuclease/phosphatase family metal-dependent hydrolase
MASPIARLRRRVGVPAALVALVAAFVVSGAPAEADAAPTGLKAAQTATEGIALTWKSTGQDAYRVRFSSSSSMSSPDTWDVLGNYFEWTRTDASPTKYAPRLTPGKTYYFQVKSIVRAEDGGDRDNLSSYSSPVAITTPSSGYPELDPVDLTATEGGEDKLYVSWRSRGPGVKYVVRYTTDPSQGVLDWSSTTFDTAGGVLKGLSAGTRYYVRSRVVDADGKALSEYSQAVAASTPESSNSPGLSFVSYNIRKPTGTPTWEQRRDLVAAAIKKQAPDVAALQEATPTATDGVKQYDDILARLGSPYELVTRTGSSGTKLAINTDRMSVVNTDVAKLTTLGDAQRYAVWALLEDKKTDKRVFVVDTHLNPGDYTATYNDIRTRQAKEVLDVIETNNPGVPVVLLGDMNSSRASKPDNGPYLAYQAGGLVDPLGSRSGSWEAGQGATAEHVLDAEYNTFNGFESQARRTSYPVGTSSDYVWTTPEVRVAMWRTVVSLDTDGRFVGTIPSDHNMVSTRIHLP